MSALVVGLSHHSASLDLLERAVLTPSQAHLLAAELTAGPDITEAVCLTTCNRLEVYAEVSRFHAGVAEIGAVLAKLTGIGLDQLSEHLYVHYDAAAVAHLFRVASGLDSMAVGETQILGQVRTAMRSAAEAGTLGGPLARLLAQSLRVGKRAHAETRLGSAGPDLIELGLTMARSRLGGGLGEVLVLGAGAMSGLAVAAADRAGATGIAVFSRTPARAGRLAGTVSGRVVPADGLGAALERADVVLACAGAAGPLVGAEAARAAHTSRGGRPQVYVDVALPRDVDPRAGELPGVQVLDLEVLGRALAERGLGEDVAVARALVEAEAADYLVLQRSTAVVAPTVVALREMARAVVTSELARLHARLDTRFVQVDPAVRAELEQTVHRVVEKLLHAPTVRVRELAAEPGGSSYAVALRALFNLGPQPAEAVMGLTEPADALSAPVPGPAALPRTLRLGTRRSPLARTQSRWVADRLVAAQAALGVPVEVELVEVTTHGDVTTAPLASLGGTGVFVSALRDALLSGQVDLAVHSLKDLPTGDAEGLALAAVPVREDPRDVLVARDGLTLAELPPGSRIGTGSPRRAAQLRALGLGLEVVAVRGNVDTRLRLVANGELDAVVLACAGLLRIGRTEAITQVLDPPLMLPAPGQGALAVECRQDDIALRAALLGIQDGATLACVTAERALLARLEAGCAAPVGALAEMVLGDAGPELSLRALVASVDGAVTLRRSSVVPLAPDIGPDISPDIGPDTGPDIRAVAAAAGVALAELMLADGASDLMPAPEDPYEAAREGDQ